MKCAICGATLPEDQPICMRCDSETGASVGHLVPDEVAGHIRAARALILLSFLLSFLFLPFAMHSLGKAERGMAKAQRHDMKTLAKIKRLKLAAVAVLLVWLVLITLMVARQSRYM